MKMDPVADESIFYLFFGYLNQGGLDEDGA